MKQVLVFPRGQLFPKDKERLTKLGIVALEADDPSKVVAVLPLPQSLSSDEVILSLAEAIQHSTQAQLVFGTHMAKRLAAKKSPQS